MNSISNASIYRHIRVDLKFQTLLINARMCGRKFAINFDPVKKALLLLLQ